MTGTTPIRSLCKAALFTALRLHSHKSQRNAKHSQLSNICLSFLLVVREGSGVILHEVMRWPETLTGRVGPMSIWAGVRRRAVVPQGGVALATMGWRNGNWTPKLAVRTGCRAERSCPWNKPATHCLHRVKKKAWEKISII